MAHKSPRYCLYREFVDASMKGHYEMTRCVSIRTIDGTSLLEADSLFHPRLYRHRITVLKQNGIK